MGDFNIDVLNRKDPKTKRLSDVMKSFGLSWSVNSPTRVTATSATAIDNIITNIPNTKVSIVKTAISDHEAQEAIIRNCRPDREPIVTTKKRDLRAENILRLNTHLSKEGWDFSKTQDADEQFNNFLNLFMFHLDVCCPLKTSKAPHRALKCSWITPGILVSRRKVKFLSQLAKSTQDAEFKLFFKKYKKIYRKVIKVAKAYDVSKSIQNSKNLSKTAWKIIHNKSGSSSSTTKSIKLKIQGSLINKPASVANEFNKFFSSVAEKQNIMPNSQASHRRRRPPVGSMVMASVTEQEVARTIKQLSPKRTNDINYTSTWLIKQCYQHIISPLTKIINTSFNTGIFPSALKFAKVIPIFKKDDPQLVNNYRPISILPIFSKIFEKLFLNQLSKFLNKHNLLSKNQFGFRAGMSTTDAVESLVGRVVEGIEGRNQTLSVFLDLSKAFDCVDHNILLQKLESYGIRGVPLSWLSSYLNDRTQSVHIANDSSSEIKLRYGVPQGSILSPLLFLIYVNDVDTSLRHGQLVQYADDTTILLKSQTKKSLELQTFIELNCCIQQFNEINLQTNASKSNFINFCLRSNSSDDCGPTVMIGETMIEEAFSVKFLGIHLDRGLTWNTHVDNVCSKVSSGIFVLRKLSTFCPKQILLMTYYGLIYPHLSYGIILWGGCSNTDFLRLFRLQKKAIRIIANLKQRDSCKPAFIELGLLTLPCLYILQTTLFSVNKCILTRGRDVHTYNTRGRDDYRTGQHRTVVCERLPSQAGVVFFNSLPHEIKSALTPRALKAELKHCLLSMAFYSVGEFLSHTWEREQF